MTGRTHDITAFTGLNIAFVLLPLSEVSLATLITAVAFNFIGGLAPDLDQPTAVLWGRVRGGSVIGKMLSPLLGGHRMISHSLIGIFLTGWLMKIALSLLGTILLVDMQVVWWAFMIGFVSHLFIDLFTREGVPLLFPLPWEFGIPPFRFLRIRTGGILEKSFIYPGLLLLNGWLVIANYQKVLEFLKEYVG